MIAALALAVSVAALCVATWTARRTHVYEKGTVDIDYKPMPRPTIYIDEQATPREKAPIGTRITIVGRGARTLFDVRVRIVDGKHVGHAPVPSTSALSPGMELPDFAAVATSVDGAVHVAVYASRREHGRPILIGHRAVLPGYETRQCVGRNCWWTECTRGRRFQRR